MRIVADLHIHSPYASRGLNQVGRSATSTGILASRAKHVRALRNAREFAEEANSAALLRNLSVSQRASRFFLHGETPVSPTPFTLLLKLK